MYRIVRWCLGNKSVVVLATVLLVAGGFYGTSRLNQELLPDIEDPFITVVTPVEGAGPEAVDERVSRPVEDAIGGVGGVEGVETTSAQGYSVVRVEFDYGADLDEAEEEIRGSIDGVALPEQAGQPEISRTSAEEFPIQYVSLSTDGETGRQSDGRSGDEELGRFTDDDLAGLTEYAEDEAIPRLEDVEGVSGVDLSGGSRRQVEIAFDPDRLQENGLAADGVLGAVAGANFDAPVGVAPIDGLSASVQTTSGTEDLEALRSLPVGGEARGAILLGDVADLGEVEANVSGISRTDGGPSLALNVNKDSEANTVEVAEGVERELEEIRDELGDADQARMVYSDADFVRESVGELITKSLIGAAAAVVIIFLFLRSIRATLVTAVALPTSVLAALLFSWGSDITLNIITLAGLTIAVGRVVDDAIVVLENSYRYVRAGYEPEEATLKGTTEVASAVTSSTLATVAVFLPLGLVGGQIGELFLPLAITVSTALLASLLVSVTIIPVLTSLFIKRRPERRPSGPLEQENPTGDADRDVSSEGSGTASGEDEGRLVRLYTSALRFSLRHRGAVLLLAFVVFVGGLGMASALPTQFLPPSEQRLLLAEVELPSGTTPEETSGELRGFEDFMLDDDGVESHQLSIGGENAADPAAVTLTNQAQAFVTLEDDASIPAVSERLEREGERLYGKDGFKIRDLGGGGGSTGEFSATITGGSDGELAEAADLVEAELSDDSDLANVESDLSGGAPGVSVRMDPERAAAAGLPAEQVARSLGAYLAGNAAGDTLSIGGTPVSVGIPPEEADSLEEIGALPVGPGVVVSDVAEVERVDAPAEVRRSDGDRTVTVSATMEAPDAGAVTAEAQESLDELELPGDVEAAVGGESDDIQEGFRDLFVAIAAAVALVYLILVIFFSSATVPLVILLAVPLTTAGAFGAQLLTGTALSVSSLLGVLLLVGIVVANSILLVDFAREAKGRHASLEDAIVEAGQVRLRPILMTALATIFSLMPLALGVGGGLLVTSALAVPVIGGLVTSTLLTLFVVPAGYSLLEGAKAQTRRPRERPTPTDPETSAVHGAIGTAEVPPGGTPSEDITSGAEPVDPVVQGNGGQLQQLHYELGRARGRVEAMESSQGTLMAERERLTLEIERERERWEQEQRRREENAWRPWWRRLGS